MIRVNITALWRHGPAFSCRWLPRYHDSGNLRSFQHERIVKGDDPPFSRLLLHHGGDDGPFVSVRPGRNMDDGDLRRQEADVADLILRLDLAQAAAQRALATAFKELLVDLSVRFTGHIGNQRSVDDDIVVHVRKGGREDGAIFAVKA